MANFLLNLLEKSGILPSPVVSPLPDTPLQKIGNAARSFVGGVTTSVLDPMAMYGKELADVINAKIEQDQAQSYANTLMAEAQKNEAVKALNPALQKILTQRSADMYSQAGQQMQNRDVTLQKEIGDIPSSMLGAMANSAMSIGGANVLAKNPLYALLGMGIGGGVGAISGRNIPQSMGQGLGEALKTGSVTQFTNPIIAGISGKLTNSLNPITGQIVGRTVTGYGNMLEDLLLSKLNRQEYKTPDALISFLIGAAMGKGGTINDWNKLVGNTNRMRNSAGQFMQDLISQAKKNAQRLDNIPQKGMIEEGVDTLGKESQQYHSQSGFLDPNAKIGDVGEGRLYDTKKLPASVRDMADEIQSVGAKINPDQTVTLYHRTTPEAAAQIRKTGQMFGKEDGIFFSTKPTGQAEGYGSDVVEVKVPLSKLELDDIFKDEAHLKIPTSKAGDVVKVNVAQPPISDMEALKKDILSIPSENSRFAYHVSQTPHEQLLPQTGKNNGVFYTLGEPSRSSGHLYAIDTTKLPKGFLEKGQGIGTVVARKPIPKEASIYLGEIKPGEPLNLVKRIQKALSGKK